MTRHYPRIYIFSMVHPGVPLTPVEEACDYGRAAIPLRQSQVT